MEQKKRQLVESDPEEKKRQLVELKKRQLVESEPEEKKRQLMVSEPEEKKRQLVESDWSEETAVKCMSPPQAEIFQKAGGLLHNSYRIFGSIDDIDG